MSASVMLNLIQHLCPGPPSVMPNLFRHLETLKQVQGDEVTRGVYHVPMSANVMLNLIQHLKKTLKQVQGDGMRECDPETSSG